MVIIDQTSILQSLIDVYAEEVDLLTEDSFFNQHQSTFGLQMICLASISHRYVGCGCPMGFTVETGESVSHDTWCQTSGLHY